ncbi:hypothetical protein V2J09_012862 [Rumex salicifolius]
MAGQPTKVVYINTQYVETDALSFKSVVQNLTGKDSEVPADLPPVNARRRRLPVAGDVRRRQPIKAEKAEFYRPEMEAVQPEIMGCRSAFLMRDMSFKEFDRLLKELPPLDDFHSLFD